MLFDVECPHCRRRFWADLAVGYTRVIYAESLLELETYILNYAKVEEVFTEEEVMKYIRKCIEIFGRNKSIEELCWIFGVPEEVMREVIKKI